ncbi:MAG: hypothetical protein V2J55_07655, partial [Candidatus Competibacteraceae bacterium]|nr:hypothetical protein [Candidatus Competibacteraceae bacterium]
FTVTTLGEDYLRGAPDNQYTLANFPETGEDAIVRWSEPHQNFVIMDASSAQSAPDNFQPPAATGQSDALAQLESPQEDSFESGISLVRGWVCDAVIVEIQIDDRPRREVAYGTNRGDTRQICGDVDNGFGFTVNWSSYGSGEHTLRLYVDGEEFTRANFTVTNLGEDYLRDASGQYTLANFPETGDEVTVRWSEPHQNFVIIDYR